MRHSCAVLSWTQPSQTTNMYVNIVRSHEDRQNTLLVCEFPSLAAIPLGGQRDSQIFLVPCSIGWNRFFPLQFTMRTLQAMIVARYGSAQ